MKSSEQTVMMMDPTKMRVALWSRRSRDDNCHCKRKKINPGGRTRKNPYSNNGFVKLNCFPLTNIYLCPLLNVGRKFRIFVICVARCSLNKPGKFITFRRGKR